MIEVALILTIAAAILLALWIDEQDFQIRELKNKVQSQANLIQDLATSNNAVVRHIREQHEPMETGSHWIN